MQSKPVMNIEISRLREHELNPNRMSGKNFKKLVDHIRRTGNYEPVIVRQHPQSADRYQIINGHHRVKALRQIGAGQVDCVIWDVDDDETKILLATLNRLGGKDELARKRELLRELARKYDTTGLSKMLAQSKAGIEALTADCSARAPQTGSSIFPHCLCFFADNRQKDIIETALKTAHAGLDKNTLTDKTAALVKICELYLERHKPLKQNSAESAAN